MTTAFTPIAKEYQVDPRHSPDKGSTWQYPEEDDGWILTHNALRGEMGCMKEAIDMVLKRGEFQQWEIEALQTIWDAHYVFVDAHHHNEDDKIQPIFAARFRYPEKGDVPGHEIIVDHLEKLSQLFKTLTVKDAKEQVPAIQVALLSYERDALPHLQWEEEKLLPLMRAYFTPAEIGRIVQDIIKHEPPHAMGSFIHFQTEKRFRSVFMKQEGIPSFVWYFVFRGALRAFRERFLQHYEALINGVAPVVQKRSFFWFW